MNTTTETPSSMIYGLHDNPPLIRKVLVALQHFLAIFVSIITAPLIICSGMGLSAEDTSYMISCSLVISGIATLIQVRTLGPVGSGLLCIQGTSFSFIGPLIFAANQLNGSYSNEQMLGVIFGSAAVGAIIVMILSQFLQRLQRVVTPTVCGTAVLLLGVTLVITTFNNLQREYTTTLAAGGNAMAVAAFAIGVVLLIVWLASRRSAMLRLASVSIGVVTGYLIALAMGMINFDSLSELPNFFTPELMRYPLGFDLGIFLILLPIYLVTATESVGDITATAKLSGLPIQGNDYWKRIKSGVLADGFNSLLASLISIFPNTTFSQNNGVIQLTGVCSRHVGIWIAVLLVLFGLFPIFGGLFMLMPKGLLFGSTGLMFAMVALSGWRIITHSTTGQRKWIIVGLAVVASFLLGLIPGQVSDLPTMANLLLSFHVATGTLCAIVLELIIPQTTPVNEPLSSNSQ